MAIEQTDATQKYHLTLMQITSNGLEREAPVAKNPGHKRSNPLLLLQILKEKKSNIPTLIRFIENQSNTVSYYVFGLSENGEEILTPLPTNVDKAAAAAEAADSPQSLTDKLDKIFKNDEKNEVGDQFQALTTISAENNSDIHQAILSLKGDHSLFPALIHRRTRELIAAFNMESESDRNEAIWDTMLKLGIDLAEYFKVKGIKLSRKSIPDFVQRIAVHPILHQTSTNLFAYIGAISAVHDEAILAFDRSQRPKDDEKDENYPPVVENHTSHRKLTVPSAEAESAANAIYQQPTTERMRIAQAFCLAGKVLKGINDQATRETQDFFPKQLTVEMLQAWNIPSSTASPLASNEALHDAAVPPIGPIQAARLLLAAIQQENRDAKAIMRAFITLLQKLPERYNDMHQLISNPDCAQILNGLRKHRDIFKQLQYLITTFKANDAYRSTAERLRNGINRFSRLLEKPEWYDKFRDASKQMSEENIVLLEGTQVEQGYPVLGWDPIESDPDYKLIDAAFTLSFEKLWQSLQSLRGALLSPRSPKQKLSEDESLSSPRAEAAPIPDTKSKAYTLYLADVSVAQDSKMDGDDEPKFILGQMQKQGAKIPTLIKFGDAYYLYGISKKEEEVAWLIRVRAGSKLLKRLQTIDFTQTLIHIDRHNTEDYLIYQAILSKKDDHSLLPALLDEYVPTLLEACETGDKNKICDAFVAFSHKFYDRYMSQKGLVDFIPLSEVVNAISTHPLFRPFIEQLSAYKDTITVLANVSSKHQQKLADAIGKQEIEANGPGLSYKAARSLALGCAFLRDLATSVPTKQSEKEKEVVAFKAAFTVELAANEDDSPPSPPPQNQADEIQIKILVAHAQSLQKLFLKTKGEKRRHQDIAKHLIACSKELPDNLYYEKIKKPLTNNKQAQQAFEALNEALGDTMGYLTAAMDLTRDVKPQKAGEERAKWKAKTKPCRNYIQLIDDILKSVIWQKSLADTLKYGLNHPQRSSPKHQPNSPEHHQLQAHSSSRHSPLPKPLSPPGDPNAVPRFDLNNEQVLDDGLLGSGPNSNVNILKPASAAKDPNKQAVTIWRVFLYFCAIPFLPVILLQRLTPLPKEKGMGWKVLDGLLLGFRSPDKLAEKYELTGGSQIIIRGPYILYWLGLGQASLPLLELVSLTIPSAFLSSIPYLQLVADFVGLSPLQTFMVAGMILYIGIQQLPSYGLHRQAQAPIAEPWR
ncbi:MAG: hypothetical protein K0Q74_1327, partial [Gammaproteobacteria bacterium]|nr:hypothetical protein [Gammaproteobacteria bacterium]